MANTSAGTARKAGFIEAMECLPVTKIPDGPEWTYEIKLDGYRLQAVKNRGRVALYSRRKNILNEKFDYIAEVLDFLPDETVIDGELVAVGPDGKPNFNLLQNFQSSEAHIIFYAFDILIHKGRDLMSRPLAERRSILARPISSAKTQ
jgi:bifunctional non-homologous end joining protein LigD